MSDAAKLDSALCRLMCMAQRVVDEYRSHGGEDTHQECMPGCGCTLPKEIDALDAEVGEAAAVRAGLR